MIQIFLWEAYSAHSSLLNTIALNIIASVFIAGVLELAMFLDRDLEDL